MSFQLKGVEYGHVIAEASLSGLFKITSFVENWFCIKENTVAIVLAIGETIDRNTILMI